jgi:predicted anti-sigma-YlaC factor YlaD
MRCHDYREAISAQLDGETTPVAPAELAAHLDGCAACRRFAATTSELHRSVRVHAAEPVPDLTRSILERIGAEPTRRHAAADAVRGLQVALFVVAVVQLAVSVPALLGSDPGLSVHAARHVGSFDVALAVAFFYVAFRPKRASGMLPFVAALVICLAVSSAVDINAGRSTIGAEAQHMTDLVALGLLWLLARATAPTSSRAVAA